MFPADPVGIGALLEPLGVGGILSAFLGGEASLRLELALLDLDPHLERRDSDRGERDQDPDPASDIIHDCPLT